MSVLVLLVCSHLRHLLRDLRELLPFHMTGSSGGASSPPSGKATDLWYLFGILRTLNKPLSSSHLARTNFCWRSSRSTFLGHPRHVPVYYFDLCPFTTLRLTGSLTPLFNRYDSPLIRCDRQLVLLLRDATLTLKDKTERTLQEKEVRPNTQHICQQDQPHVSPGALHVPDVRC